jgi:hypothetical protein
VALLQSTIMNETEDGASAAQAWLARLNASAGAEVEALPLSAPVAAAALATLAAEALAGDRSLLLVTADDEPLANISNALDLNLRPLCLVLPAAEHSCRIALRATLALLRSRLSRAGDDAEGPAWFTQRQRLAEHADLWQQCLAWSNRGLDSEAWPAGLQQLFPVRILPMALARQISVDTEWVVLADAMAAGTETRPWPGARRTLMLCAPAGGGALTAADPAARQRAELEVLTQELAELELELATAHAEIGDFTGRYQAMIGTRLIMLDSLRAELAVRRAKAEPANIEAGRAADAAWARAEQSRRENARFEEIAHAQQQPFAPSGDIRKLYRKLAQKIHPDRARNDSDRAWRTQLMAEANRAYRSGDEAGLLEVLALWQEGNRCEPAASSDAGALDEQLTQLKRRIGEIEEELNRLFGSRLYELFTATNIARRACRDLLQEMADRLDTDIAAARAELAAC